ncbi:MAG TPA: sensor histidine kinase, partial [Thermoanaerobaculia bacterium]|nr:sensor histidine kinase [Thermoanaerobaculia bacterium]
MTRPRTLRRRVAVAFIVFAAVVCLLYSALAFLFVYAVEDEFFAALLENEGAYIAGELSAGRKAGPRLPF